MCDRCRCWTQGKPDKLKNLRLARMWYLTEQCSPLESLVAKDDREDGATTDGPIYTAIMKNTDLPQDVQWDKLGEMCCTAVEGAP